MAEIFEYKDGHFYYYKGFYYRCEFYDVRDKQIDDPVLIEELRDFRGKQEQENIISRLNYEI